MAIIYIPVEVPDEEVQRYLGRASLGGLEVRDEPGPTMQRVPSEFGYQVQQAPQPDPWGGPATPAAYPAAAPTPASTPAATAAPTTPQGPACHHGPMRYVPAGFSKNSGKAYPAFWGCTAQRGQPQCKSVPAS